MSNYVNEGHLSRLTMGQKLNSISQSMHTTDVLFLVIANIQIVIVHIKLEGYKTNYKYNSCAHAVVRMYPQPHMQMHTHTRIFIHTSMY